MNRRHFLARSGAAIGAAAVGYVPAGVSSAFAAGSQDPSALADWKGVRAQFDLDPDLIHMASFYLVSHPRPVREAIERHRRGLDANPIDYLHHHTGEATRRVLECAGRYLGVQPGDIALTDSTTMGLGLVYSSVDLQPGQEVLTTEHDHYSTNRSLDLRAERAGDWFHCHAVDAFAVFARTDRCEPHLPALAGLQNHPGWGDEKAALLGICLGSPQLGWRAGMEDLAGLH